VPQQPAFRALDGGADIANAHDLKNHERSKTKAHFVAGSESEIKRISQNAEKTFGSNSSPCSWLQHQSTATGRCLLTTD
jgi:hypothetical protein